MSVDQSQTNRLRRGELPMLVAVLAMAIVVYLPTFGYLWARWNADVQYSLAWLVPFVSGYFVWKKWSEVKALDRAPSNWGLALIGAGLLVHLAGEVLDITGPSAVSLLMCLLGGCLYFHGPALVRTLWFPLAYTVFMIPVPGGIITMLGLPMQLGASAATAAILRTMGFEVFRSGVNLTVDGNSYEVAQACSGMSSLVALIGVSAVFVYLTSLPSVYKWILFVLSVPVAVAANVVRITTIGLVGSQWGRDVAMHVYHKWSSPILFIVAVLLLFAISRGFECLSARRTTS